MTKKSKKNKEKVDDNIKNEEELNCNNEENKVCENMNHNDKEIKENNIVEEYKDEKKIDYNENIDCDESKKIEDEKFSNNNNNEINGEQFKKEENNKSNEIIISNSEHKECNKSEKFADEDFSNNEINEKISVDEVINNENFQLGDEKSENILKRDLSNEKGNYEENENKSSKIENSFRKFSEDDEDYDENSFFKNQMNSNAIKILNEINVRNESSDKILSRLSQTYKSFQETKAKIDNLLSSNFRYLFEFVNCRKISILDCINQSFLLEFVRVVNKIIVDNENTNFSTILHKLNTHKNKSNRLSKLKIYENMECLMIINQKRSNNSFLMLAQQKIIKDHIQNLNVIFYEEVEKIINLNNNYNEQRKGSIDQLAFEDMLKIVFVKSNKLTETSLQNSNLFNYLKSSNDYESSKGSSCKLKSIYSKGSFFKEPVLVSLNDLISDIDSFNSTATGIFSNTYKYARLKYNQAKDLLKKYNNYNNIVYNSITNGYYSCLEFIKSNYQSKFLTIFSTSNNLNNGIINIKSIFEDATKTISAPFYKSYESIVEFNKTDKLAYCESLINKLKITFSTFSVNNLQLLLNFLKLDFTKKNNDNIENENSDIKYRNIIFNKILGNFIDLNVVSIDILIKELFYFYNKTEEFKKVISSKYHKFLGI